MAVPAKYQIFISSTYEDLREERDQVIKAVLEMGHIPVGMEMFSAADEEQWQIISRHIDQSDYYVVVVAHRLGSLTPERISFTRKEYEYARLKGIPCLGFIIDDVAKWPADRVDRDSGNKGDLDAFKGLIREKPVSFWATAEDLHGKVSIALMKAFTAQPREGWVRASSVMGPEVTNELTRLSAENATLRGQLAEKEAAAAKDHQAKLRELARTLFNTKSSPSYRLTKAGPWLNDSEVSLFDVFDYLAPELIVERSVNDLASNLAMHIRTSKDGGWDIVAVNQVKTMMADLMTVELVQPSARKHPVSDTNEYWSLSQLGIEMLKMFRQFNLSPLPAAEDAGTDSDQVDRNEQEGPKPPRGSATKAGEGRKPKKGQARKPATRTGNSGST